MIGIIDYDAGNIRSVEKAMKYLGQDVCITRDRDTLLRADKVILPGVGSFGDAMNHLQEYGLVEVIHELTELEKPFLGICLGGCSFYLNEAKTVRGWKAWESLKVRS